MSFAADLTRRVLRSARARLARAVPWRRIRDQVRDRAASAWYAAWYALADSRPSRALQLASGLATPRVGGMATMPSRAGGLTASLDSILPQVDVLYVYLDKHDAIPQTLKARRKVVAILPADLPRLLGRTEGLGPAGKFLATVLHPDCLFFGFDDDIVYPRDHTRRLAATLKRYGGRAVAGVFGLVYRAPYQSYVNDRETLHFATPLPAPREVDELGTGTIAFRTALFRPDFLNWTSARMLDLMLAIEAHGRGLPRVAVARPQSYLRAITEVQDDSLWAARRKDDSVESALLRANPQLWTRRIPAMTASAQ